MNAGIERQTVLLLAAILGTLLLSSGIALAATISCQVGLDCLGTKKADTLTGTASLDDIYGRGGGDTLRGLGETDRLLGQSGKDRLLGGPTYDYMVGGAGNDALSGGGGPDEYYFGDGWGKDTITDTTTPNTKVRFHDLQAGTPNTEGVIVDLISGVGPEAKDESGANTINWDGSVIDSVFGGDGDDRITGNGYANRIGGGDGADTIQGDEGDDLVYGQDGDDEIHVDDGSTGDAVHCGAGEDTVSFDAFGPYGFIRDSIDPDCEHLVANP